MNVIVIECYWTYHNNNVSSDIIIQNIDMISRSLIIRYKIHRSLQNDKNYMCITNLSLCFRLQANVLYFVRNINLYIIQNTADLLTCSI